MVLVWAVIPHTGISEISRRATGTSIRRLIDRTVQTVPSMAEALPSSRDPQLLAGILVAAAVVIVSQGAATSTLNDLGITDNILRMEVRQAANININNPFPLRDMVGMRTRVTVKSIYLRLAEQVHIAMSRTHTGHGLFTIKCEIVGLLNQHQAPSCR